MEFDIITAAVLARSTFTPSDGITCTLSRRTKHKAGISMTPLIETRHVYAFVRSCFSV